MRQYSVAIVGASNLFREGLHAILRRSKFTVIPGADRLDDVKTDLSLNKPDLVIFAVSSGEDPVAQIEQISLSCESLNKTRIVLLAEPLTTEQLRDAAAAGAHAVVSKGITGEVLHRVLELVMLGQQLFPGQPGSPPPRGNQTSLVPFARPVPASVASVPGTERSAGDGSARGVIHTIFTEGGIGRAMTLSDRERQILRCLMDGASNKTIARHLAITEATVKVHIKGLLRKIRVTNRTQAAVWGLNNTEVFGQPAIPAPVEQAATERLAVCQVAS